MTVSESSAEVAFTANVLGARIEIYDDRDRLQDAQDDILRLGVSPGSYVVVATNPTGKRLEEAIKIGVGESLEHRFRFSPTASLLPIPGLRAQCFRASRNCARFCYRNTQVVPEPSTWFSGDHAKTGRLAHDSQ